MPVTISRFVNVMSGGLLKTDWWEKPLHKQDTKVFAALKEVEAGLSYADGMGLMDDKDLKKLKDEFEEMRREFYGGGGGKSPKKFLEIEERIKKDARKSVEKIAKILTEKETAVMEDAVGAEEYKSRFDATAEQLGQSGMRVDALSPAEMVAIRTYTLSTPREGKQEPGDPDFRDMNKLYRNMAKDRQNSNAPRDVIVGDTAKIKAKIALLEKAMSKLPNFTATQPTYRLDVYMRMKEVKWPGWPGIFDGYNMGSEFTVDAFWSTGKTGTITTVAEQTIIWTVYGGSGKDIDALSEMKGEGGGEVLYQPRTKFKVEAKSIDPQQQGSNNKVWRLTVREVVE